jgi:hypothetical protein
VHEVAFPLADPPVLAKVVRAERVEPLVDDGETLRTALDGACCRVRELAATGGGLAEILQACCPTSEASASMPAGS